MGPIAQTAGISAGVISTQNLNPLTGVPTALSTVIATLLGSWDTVAIQVFGTYTGALSIQVQLDGTNWVTLTGVTSITNTITGVQTANIPSGTQGVYQIDISGFTGIRVTALGAVTGTATVTIIPGIGSGIVGIDTPIVLAGGNGSAVIGSLAPNANPGQQTFALNSAATTNATLIKGSAGIISSLTINNTSAAAKYVRFYNKATAPTVGTDTPIFVVTILANTSKEVTLSIYGKRFTTGISYAITNAAGVLDATAVAAGDVQISGDYV